MNIPSTNLLIIFTVQNPPLFPKIFTDYNTVNTLPRVILLLSTNTKISTPLVYYINIPFSPFLCIIYFSHNYKLLLHQFLQSILQNFSSLQNKQESLERMQKRPSSCLMPQVELRKHLY